LDKEYEIRLDAGGLGPSGIDSPAHRSGLQGTAAAPMLLILELA
jgi:hypothetical protein